MKIRIPTYIIFVLLLFVSCNTTKYVPEGEYLLNKTTIKTDTKDIPKDVLHGYLRQTPNSFALGLFRIQLGIYNWSGQDTAKWINRTLKRIGDEPVIYNPSLTSISAQQLQLSLHNKGYMNARVETKLHTKGKNAEVEYIITSNKPYRIRDYGVELENETLLGISTDTSRTLVKPLMQFDVDMLEKERERITSRFRQLGYYNFNKDFLSYTADSTLNSNQIDLKLGLHDIVTESPDSINKLIFKKFTIRNVVFYINDESGLTANAESINALDTIRNGNYFLVAADKPFLRLNTLILNTHIIPKTRYSDRSIEQTYSSLNSLDPVKYVNINLRQIQDTLLDCYIFIAPGKTVALSAEAEATYTEGFWGVATNAGIRYKNLFRGAETLSLQGRVAFEKQNDVFAQEWGIVSGLKFPSFLLPFLSTERKRNLKASTEVTGVFNYQFRPTEYTVRTLGVGLRYIWTQRRARQYFDFFDLNYVDFSDINAKFWNDYILSEKYNRYNYEDHVIMRMGYSGTYSTFSQNRPLKNYSSMRYSIESAGNILYGISVLIDQKKDQNGFYNFFKVPFSQYVKGEFNLSHHQIVDKNNRFVYHVGVGIGMPYGNAEIIPYEKRFFSGGANSIRGWGEATLGPGTYDRKNKRGRDYNQTGDLKLDLNMEYRTKLFWLLEGALFLDAGNIWTIRNYENQPGGVFRKDSFLSEIGIAYGAGIRLDFSYFLIRLDVGTKLYNPVLEKKKRWRVSPTLIEDFALHLAIGYPF